MSNDIVKKDPTSIDGFAGWNDGVEGDDRPEGAGVIQGNLIKFSNEAAWQLRDNEELLADFELVAVDVARVVVKWGPDQKPVENGTIILEPDQKFPDIEAMNENTPREEWVEGPDRQMRGPWQGQHVLYLLDLKTMDKFSYPTSTTGGRIAIRELRDKLVWMRRLKGANVYPVITLADKFMNTRFGGRQRPHFMIKRWVRLGGEGGEVEAIAPPTPPTTTQQALDEFSKPVAATAPQSDLPLTEVKEPTLAKEMNDAIPDFDAKPKTANEPKKAPAPRPTARRDLKTKSSTKTTARSVTRKRLTNIDAG
jgi:hypothetical protein